MDGAGEWWYNNHIMQNTQFYLIIYSGIGLLGGLIIAEIAWRKAMHHANHVVPAAITKNSNKIVWQKIFYYGVLGSLLVFQKLSGVAVPEPVYWLVSFAIAGGDVQKLANKFFRIK